MEKFFKTYIQPCYSILFKTTFIIEIKSEPSAIYQGHNFLRKITKFAKFFFHTWNTIGKLIKSKEAKLKK